jgi:hypothetical protein
MEHHFFVTTIREQFMVSAEATDFGSGGSIRFFRAHADFGGLATGLLAGRDPAAPRERECRLILTTVT